MRHGVRRFQDGERGAGLIEYALLSSGVGIALVGMLTFFGSTTGDVAHRAAASVQAQATRGYGAPGTVDREPVEGTLPPGSATDEPDSTSAKPDSSAAPGVGTPSPDPARP